MAGIDDLFEFMDAEQRRQDEENSLSGQLASGSDAIINAIFGKEFVDKSNKTISRSDKLPFPEKLGAALGLSGKIIAQPPIRAAGGIADFLKRIGAGASSVYDDSTIDDSLESPNTTAAIQTSADYTKAIKDNMAKEAARNIQDNQKILKQLGIGEYISQEASKASPFFVIKGNEPSTSDSKTKGFSRSSRSIGEKAREDNYSKILQAIESGDFSSASGALSGLPKEDKTNFLALINTAQQRPQSRGDETPLGLVAAIKTIEAYNASPPDIKQDKQARAKYFEALDVLSKYQQ